MMKNESIGQDKYWVEDGYRFREVISQEYANCKFSGGFIEGHPVDTIYLLLEKDGAVKTHLLLRPDEVAALAWVATGVLWSEHMKDDVI